MKDTYTKTEVELLFRKGRAGFTSEGNIKIKTDDGKYIICSWDSDTKSFANCKEITREEAKEITAIESINKVNRILDTIVDSVNNILVEIKHLKERRERIRRHRTIRDLKKWRPPVTREERRDMYRRNPKCFLKVEKTKTGEILPKYPVCPHGSTTPTLEGAVAALRRANINHDREVADKAFRLAKELAKERGIPEESIPDPWYK